MKVAPPPAVAPLAQEDEMRWDPFNDGIAIKPLGRYAPDYYGKRAPATATSHKNRVGVLLVVQDYNLTILNKKKSLVSDSEK